MAHTAEFISVSIPSCAWVRINTAGKLTSSIHGGWCHGSRPGTVIRMWWVEASGGGDCGSVRYTARTEKWEILLLVCV